MLVRGSSTLLSSTMLLRATQSATSPLNELFSGMKLQQSHYKNGFSSMAITLFSVNNNKPSTNAWCRSMLASSSILSSSSSSSSSAPVHQQQSKRGLRHAGKPKPDVARPVPYAESLGRMPFQGILLNAPPIIPRSGDQWTRWKIYLAQQLRNFRFLFEAFGFSVRKARAFKAEAAEIYTQYLKALAAQDIAKLGFLIPPEKTFDYKKIIVQPGIERDLKLLSEVGPLKIVNTSHIKGTFGGKTMDTMSILVRITSEQEIDVYQKEKGNRTLIQKIGPVTVTENVVFEKNMLKPKAEQKWRIASVIEHNPKDTRQLSA